MQWLVIKLTSPEAETASYALLGQQQKQDGFSTSGWRQLKELSRGKRIILLIPSEEVVLNRVAIPTTNKKQLAKAIPYALEDSLAEDVDTLHFVHYRETDDQAVNISAINNDRLNKWVKSLNEHGLNPHAILPDIFALPVEAETAALAIHDQRALFRNHIFSGFSADSILLPVLLPEVLADEGLKTLLVDAPDDLQLQFSEDIEIKMMVNMHRQCDASLIEALPLNLLNDFTREGGQNSFIEGLSHWKSVAMLLTLMGGIWMASLAVQNYQLKQRVSQLDNEISTVYSKTFPKSRIDSDYRVLHSTMAEKLKALNVVPDSMETSPLEILAVITPTFKKHKDITISKVMYDPTGLNLAISAPSLSGLEEFRAAIDIGDINAQVVASSSSAKKSETTLKITKEKQ